MNPLHQHVINIFQAGLDAVHPERAMKKHLRLEGDILSVGEKQYNLSQYKNIDVIGAGKAGAFMARAIESILSDRIRYGFLVVKYGHTASLNQIKLHEAGHPVPDEAGVQGTQEILHILNQSGEEDLIFCLISGGGSALLPAPVDGISLEEKQKMTQILLSCGATIHEINVLRKHISILKGGQLARLAYPSTLVSLILSDVIGDNLDVIASGLTAPDASTFQDCLSILKKYQLQDKMPANIVNHLKKGQAGIIPETPKTGDICFQNIQNQIIGNNEMAARAAAEKAEALGYSTKILSTILQGEAREAAKYLVNQLKFEMQKSQKPVCLIAGGETTVTLRGNGKGGRNQELALDAAIHLQNMKNVCLLSAGTDGTDGPTDAAGAIVDGETVNNAHNLKMDPVRFLENNNAYHFFEKTGGLVKTGPTNTNVMDLQILLAGTSSEAPA